MFMENLFLKNTNVTKSFEILIEITIIEAKISGNINTNKALKLKNEKNNILQKNMCFLFK